MPPAEGTAEEITLNIPFPETFVYSNCTALALSHMDFHLGFAEVLPSQTVVAKVGIVMPPEHVAVLVLSLIEQLRSYEQNFGEIRHPKWRAMKANAKAKQSGDVGKNDTKAELLADLG
jgi:hypothetical protein